MGDHESNKQDGGDTQESGAPSNGFILAYLQYYGIGGARSGFNRLREVFSGLRRQAPEPRDAAQEEAPRQDVGPEQGPGRDDRPEGAPMRDVGTSPDPTMQGVVGIINASNNESGCINETYDYLFDLERRQPIARDHLAGQQKVRHRMRAILIDWVIAAHLKLRLQPETLQLAIAIIDRYLQAVQNTTLRALQLVGVTALFIATKYVERLNSDVRKMCDITANSYTEQQIFRMEKLILKAIDYSLSRPRPIDFLQRYLKAASLPGNELHFAMSQYFIELAAVEYDLASYLPSEIAAAALFLTLNLLTFNLQPGPGLNDQHWSPALTYYSRYSADHLRPIAFQMAKLARGAPRAQRKSAYRKYRRNQFHRIALRPELYGPQMNAILV